MNKVSFKQNVVVKLLKTQGGCCAICTKEFSGLPVANKDKPLICQSCDKALQHFNYGTSSLHRALNYLRG